LTGLDTDISLRAATWDDRQLLLGWSNDPTTRGNSFDPRPIAMPDHEAWLRRRLAEPETRIYIGLHRAVPCGVVRFERRADGATEVSISVDPSFRGRGLAAPLLRLARDRYIAECGVHRVVARVKTDNIASLRAFRRAGYRDSRVNAGIIELAIG
jgi:RimJ/RimL family protein N-acetyltransferase